MGVLDLYVADFPHGTEAGHARGCKGAACSNHGTDLPTCATAHRYYLADYRYRRLVDAGELDAAWAMLLEETHVDAPKSKVRVGRGDPTNALVTETKFPVAPPPPRPIPAPVFSPSQEAATRPKAPPQVKPEQHGTAYGYQLGCRKPADCPADPTCSAAMSTYQQDLKAAKKRAAEMGITLAELRKLDARAETPPAESSREYSEPLEPSSPPAESEDEASRRASADIEAAMKQLGDSIDAVLSAWRRHFPA